MNKYLLCFIFFWTVLSSYAYQDNKYQFKNIDNKQGLSQNGVLAIFQDKDGHMWFGTRYGLNFYNGYQMKSFYGGNTKSDLAGNTIQAIIQDYAGNIWISTDEGVSVYNPVTKKFFNLGKYGNSKNIFSQNITSMKLLGGKILITSTEGLWLIDSVNKLFTEELAITSANLIEQNKITSLLDLNNLKVIEKDIHDGYWFTTKNYVISAKIVNKQLIIIDKILLENDLNLEITSLYQDHLKNFWAGTSNNGLFKIKLNKGNYVVNKINQPLGLKNNFTRITDIIQDSDHNLFVTSRSDGIMIIKNKDLSINNPNVNILEYPQLPSKKIKSIYISRDRTLWLGSLGNGIYYHNNYALNFTNYQFSNSLKNNSVNFTRCIAQDSYKRLWFGTLFEGLYIYNPKKLNVVATLLKGKTVFSIQSIDNNHFFAGCSDGLYLITYQENSFDVRKIATDIKLNTTIFSIDRVGNQFWAGGNENLISFSINKEYQPTKLAFYKSSLFSNLKTQNSIRCVRFDAKHQCVWIGTEISGLIKATLNPDFSIKELIPINNSKDDLIGPYITDINIDYENDCWLGTRNGLIHFTLTPKGEISKITRFTIKDGLPSNLIQSIRNDRNGNLWLGTIKGLVKFNKTSHEVVNYDIVDGIQDYEFAEHSSFKSEDGKLFFGGINGVSAFDPYQIKHNQFVEKPIVSKFFINGNPADSLLNSNTAIILDNDQNTLKFNFINLNFINPKKCKYAHMLEGFDDDWVYTSAENRTAEYTNLSSGKYVFKLKATNEDGKWGNTIVEIPVEIKASIWFSFTAFLFYLIIISSIVYLIIYITKYRLQKRHNILIENQYRDQIQKINQAKLQFFINISHEIRTPLTLIVCSIEKLLSNFKLNKEQEKEAITIDKNINRMLGLTNELLEISKIETGKYQLNVQKNDIVTFIKNIEVVFETLAEKQGIHLTIETYQPEVFIFFDASALEKVIYNLLSNAIKYTKRGGLIKLNIYPSDHQELLNISVADNGIGIDKDHVNKIFDRFYHYGGNKDSFENGFGVGLSLTKDLIELHKGTINVTSQLNKGSIFTIGIPFNENVYGDDEKADKVIWKSNNSNLLFQETENLEIEIDEVPGNNSKHKTTLLYIDDNKELLKNISNYLSDTYYVLTTESAETGLAMAAQYQPDVIISDIVMPEMDGFEVCTALKNDFKTSHIPVILLTARGDAESHLKGIESGADYFIPKPFNIKLLNLTIHNIIKSREKLRKVFLNNDFNDAQEITTNSRDKEFMEKLLHYVDEHIGEDDLNIQIIAESFAMSRSTFFRKIKAITGTTGKEFIDSIRLKKAARMLIESDMNISEIAYEIGHSNPQYFSKWFKAHYKISPTEYIATHKKS